MSVTPKRIQRKRLKGWRMPDGAVYVGRPSGWANPFRIGAELRLEVWSAVDEQEGWGCALPISRDLAVDLFKAWALARPYFLDEVRAELAGRDLACWCPLPEPGEPDVCHGAVLIALANPEPSSDPDWSNRDMIDETTPLPLSVRVSATYPASDGSAPECIDVVWETGAPDSHGIARVIGALADVARDRYAAKTNEIRVVHDRQNREALARLLQAGRKAEQGTAQDGDEEAGDDVRKAAPRAEGGPIRSDLIWHNGPDEREHVTFPEAGAGGTHPIGLPSLGATPRRGWKAEQSPGTDKDEDGDDGTASVPAMTG